MTALRLFPSNVKMVNPDGTGTPEFLRALAIVLERLGGVDGTGAGVTGVVGGVNLPDFTMKPVAAGGPVSRRWEHAATNPNGWNTSGGTMTFDAVFRSNSFFAANPSAHFGIGLRCDIAMMSTQARFHGVIMGNVIGVQEGAPHAPAAQLESRATGLDPGGALRFLLPNSWTPTTKLMEDGVDYRINITSKRTANDQRYIAYKLWKKNVAHSETGFAGDLIVDTGDMLDPNTWLDMTQQGLVFFSVFEDNLVPWTIDWSDVDVTWSGPEIASTDVSERVNRYGAEVESDLTFVGNGRRIYTYNDSSGVAFNNWTKFVSSVANSNTTVLAAPNGTSTASNFMATNRSSLSGAFGSVDFGMVGDRARILAYGVSVAHPEIDVTVGAATVATFKPNGIKLNGATEVIGPVSTRVVVANAGGANALGLSQANIDLETYSTAGYIQSLLTDAGWTAGMKADFELATRALPALISGMAADNKAKRLG